MGYVYPNNLMTKRSETKQVIKGVLFLMSFFVVIVGLFLASETGQSQTFAMQINCIPVQGELRCDLNEK